MKAVSLFAGCGGGDLGIIGGFEYLGKKYSRNPFEIIFANDIDEKALKTYSANFNSKHIVCKDIKELDVSEIPQEYDLLVGGFPCQSFSTVNPNKDPFDDRANLYKEMIRVLRGTKPKFFIAENVKGFLTLMKGSIFKRVYDEFEKSGYRLSYQLINSADYGVPQKRERVFIVGVREDMGQAFTFPKATHSQLGDNDLAKWTPLNQVIESLIPEDPKYYFSQRAVEGMKRAKNNMKRGLYQDLDGPCLTITSHLAKVSLNSRDPVLLVDAEKEIYRRFTPREAARIQSFPDQFKFEGSDSDAYRQIGNAIPPLVMWHLVNSIAEQYGDCSNNDNIELGPKIIIESNKQLKLVI